MFLAYSWDSEPHKEWVLALAERLRGDGVDALIDHWGLAPGASTTHFMEQSIEDSKYVLVICTPRYKQKAESRAGGAGYEGAIITSKLLRDQGSRKFIPILRDGADDEAVPIWIDGRVRIDLRGDAYQDSQYQDLLDTLHDERPKPPPITRRVRPNAKTALPNQALPLVDHASQPLATQELAQVAAFTLNVSIIDESGTPIVGAHVRVISSNGTYKDYTTTGDKYLVVTRLIGKSTRIYVAHPQYRGRYHNVYGFTSEVAFVLKSSKNSGSFISDGGWDSVPGIEGGINIVHDQNNGASRLYAYTNNLSINDSSHQPYHFTAPSPLNVRGSNGRTTILQVVSTHGKSFLVNYTKLAQVLVGRLPQK